MVAFHSVVRIGSALAKDQAEGTGTLIMLMTGIYKNSEIEFPSNQYQYQVRMCASSDISTYQKGSWADVD